MNIHSHEEALTKFIGEKNSESRKEYEAEVQNEIDLINMGQAIRIARQQRGLSQETLGQLIGVKRSRMCQIEKGEGLTLSTITKSLKALQVKSSIVIEGVGRYSLA